MKSELKVGDKLKVKNAVVNIIQIYINMVMRAKIQFVFNRNRKTEL